VIGNIPSPPELHLSPLQPIVGSPGTTLLDGASATPSRVLAAMQTASFVEVHVHGLVGIADDDAAMLVLAPEVDGRFALTASDLAEVKLVAHPIVVLAACEAASASPAFHVTWGLADAFLKAGASAVIASPGAIGDASAPQFFTGVRRRIQAGNGPASALRDEREAWRDPAQRRWIDHLVVFQ
jgi:CHAT domain-containing protein